MVVKAIAVIVVLAVVAVGISTLFGSTAGTEMRTFNSYGELKNFVNQNSGSSSSFYGFGVAGATESMRATAGVDMISDSNEQTESAKSTDYSTTNIQVEGVDEADIVKNDGKYIYTISGNKILIVDAYPASGMNLVSEIEVNQSIGQFYINGNKLIVFSRTYEQASTPETECFSEMGCGSYGDRTAVYIYDITDRSNPTLADTVVTDGNYLNSRMIGDYVYVISNKYVRGADPVLPIYRVNGVESVIAPTDIFYYPYPDSGFSFNIITAVNVQSSEVNSKVYLLGSSYNLYVSQDNIFMTGTKSIDNVEMFRRTVEEVYIPLLPPDKAGTVKVILDSDKSYNDKNQEIYKILTDYSNALTGDAKAQFGQALMEKSEEFYKNIQKELEKTVIHKIGISGANIDYKAVGEVPGRVLNQFSMDEYEGNFRITTTTGNTWQGGSLNHLYVLNSDLNIAGKVEDLAPGERIYSTRFIGAKAYVVTFRKIDPLFVIDVSNPTAPQVLGYLKITGYSDYLHPYDENHIIGIGKETAGGNEQFSWYQGVKISLFDVTDVANPIEKAKIELGDRGTNSNALYDHKAFLFDKEKGIIVIPISLSEIDESKYAGQEIPDNAYGQFVWQGAIVLNIDTEGITERGRVTHNDNQTEMSRWGYYNNENAVQRSLYMDDVLYTVSNKKIKANDLQTVEEINTLDLPHTQNYYPYIDFVR